MTAFHHRPQDGSLMHELFERLLEMGEPGIVEMKLVRHQENVELEFKRKWRQYV
jgi:hypothetical protein